MIDFGITIPNKIKCMPNTMYIDRIEYGERKTSGGLYIPKEKMDYLGNFIRPRWCRVKYKADNIKYVDVGDWILLDHGCWSTSMKMEIKGEIQNLWFISTKSIYEGLMAVSKTMPENLKEFGIEDN